MGTIIELLMDNIFFVIIILGIISSMLSKMKQPRGEEVPGRHPQQAPNSSANPPRTVFEDPVEEKRVTFKELQLQRERDAKQAYSEERLKPTEDGLQQRRRESKKPIRTQQPLSNQGFSGSAVQGMMWAQVFGPPRSKNPHRGGPKI